MHLVRKVPDCKVKGTKKVNKSISGQDYFHGVEFSNACQKLDSFLFGTSTDHFKGEIMKDTAATKISRVSRVQNVLVPISG